MEMTVIQMVQSVLNDMDSDEVNSINDTLEALQVASILRDTYFELIARRTWPHLRSLCTLDGVADVNKPNYLQIPSDVSELTLIKYNCKKASETDSDYQDLTYLEPDVFLAKANQLRESQSNVTQITDTSGVKFNIRNDVSPRFWTSFDDEYIICDSYDSAVDNTLQGSKTQAVAYRIPSWTNLDSFTPDLPEEAFPLLLAETKSTAFLALKQVANEKSEQISKRQQRRLSRKGWKGRGGIRFENYGRKPNPNAWTGKD